MARERTGQILGNRTSARPVTCCFAPVLMCVSFLRLIGHDRCLEEAPVCASGPRVTREQPDDAYRGAVPRTPDIGDGLCGVFDLVAEGELGAGVSGEAGVELVAEGGDGAGAAGRGQRVEPDGEGAGAGDDVAAGAEGFADQGVRFVVCAGVAAVQCPCEGGFGVAGGHPDGVGDELGLGVQPHHVRVVLAERDLGGGGFCFGLGGFELPACRVDGCAECAEVLVGDDRGGAGGGAAQRGELVLAGGFGGGEGAPGVLDGCGRGLLGRVGDHPAGVVGGGGVAVEGVEGEVCAGVPEVVLFPPPAGHRVDDAGGGQDSGAAGGEDVDLAALVAAGDLPQVQHLAFVLAAGDGQLDPGVGEVVAALPAVVPGVRHDGELVLIDVGDVFAGLFPA